MEEEILARLVQIEAVVGVLESGHLDPARN